MFIDTVAEANAVGEVADMYAGDREANGYVPNYTKTFSRRPELYGAWATLNKTIKSHLDLRLYELATLAAAARSFFTKVLDAMGTRPDGAYRRPGSNLLEALTVGRPLADD